MTDVPSALSRSVLARPAGLFYLAIILAGVSAEAVFRGPLIDFDDPSGTVAAIRGAGPSFRLSIAADLLMAVSDAALAILLFLLFRPVSAGLALAALVFRLIQTAIIAAGLLFLQGAWLLASGTGADEAAAPRALLLLDLHRHGYDLGLVFFAINCFLTGALIVRCGFLPRWLGLGIAAAGAVYLAGSLLRFFAPAALPAFEAAYVVPLVMESAFCLWLLFGRLGTRTAPAARPR
ncbi:hypothetical protein CSC94_05170 [Zhengella mangrovi]|uniref:DUF4386 domain-containing protein n=1 Tax=Zhengella mangrovi TaxID=1982044 RepID=A0A2G1QRB7_9HYPH|nr:DUF4386 domain-containing protein [Zhengella mangrovi]PHP68055.1 hypothetical protein CSC94_05170 [Zhengella mangrovi]